MPNPLTPAECLELDKQVAERREVKPEVDPARVVAHPNAIWKFDPDVWDWVPVHHPSTDIAAAWVMWEEMRGQGNAEGMSGIGVYWGRIAGDRPTHYGLVWEAFRKLTPESITRAWLAWDGAKKMEVENV